jgi:hypothetical protein
MGFFIKVTLNLFGNQWMRSMAEVQLKSPCTLVAEKSSLQVIMRIALLVTFAAAAPFMKDYTDTQKALVAAGISV